MIGATPWPHLVVLAVGGVGHEGLGAMHVRPVRVPVATVGVQDRLHMEDALVQVAFDVVALARHQPVGGEHRRFRGRRLVAVHAVAEVHDDRQVTPPIALGGLQVLHPNLLDALEVVGR